MLTLIVFEKSLLPFNTFKVFRDIAWTSFGIIVLPTIPAQTGFDIYCLVEKKTEGTVGFRHSLIRVDLCFCVSSFFAFQGFSLK